MSEKNYIVRVHCSHQGERPTYLGPYTFEEAQDVVIRLRERETRFHTYETALLDPPSFEEQLSV